MPGPIASDFFKLLKILVSEESSYFSHDITPGEFYSWKVYRLEDINENVTIAPEMIYWTSRQYAEIACENKNMSALA